MKPTFYLLILSTDCGIDSDISLPDDGTVYNLTSPNYPFNYPVSSEFDITCQWYVTSSTGSAIYVHFDDFYTDTNDAYLYFGRDENSWRELIYTGYNLPLDLISPNGSDSIVITFKVERFARPYRGFSIQLSDAHDGIGK